MTLPLAYLAAAAAAFVMALTGLPWLASELAGHYYHPRVLALTHTVTLGWITLSILGASYQLIPVVLERSLWSERLARWQLGVLLVGVTGMVTHFWIGTWAGLACAAALMGLGVSMHLINVAASLRGFERWTFTARLVTLGQAGLALTVLFGTALAVNHVWPFLPGQLFPALHAHVHLALAWWIAPMLMGVSARVFPIFLLSPEPRGWPGPLQLYGLLLGAPVLVVGLVAVPALVAPGALALAAAAASHVVWVIAMARGRRRARLDWGLRFILTASGFLPLGTALGLALSLDLVSGPRIALAYAVLLLGGWVSLSIVGMMLKIVPFLVWYRVYSPLVGRWPVPVLAGLSWPVAEGMAWALLTAGFLSLTGAAAAGNASWIAASGATLAVGSLSFTAALGRVLSHLAAPAPVQATSAGAVTR
ncbi:MAG TPA: hypothetical protein VGR44_04835 [Methylomirabilota bacterium]|nr:hypothetical protein [Methylomirabilota bacterium]